jgi:hypothetical protein
MCPPLDSDSPPLDNDQRVMSLLFGDDGNPICKSNCFNKILELEDTLQTFAPSTSLTCQPITWNNKTSISASVKVGSPPRQATHCPGARLITIILSLACRDAAMLRPYIYVNTNTPAQTRQRCVFILTSSNLQPYSISHAPPACLRQPVLRNHPAPVRAGAYRRSCLVWGFPCPFRHRIQPE